MRRRRGLLVVSGLFVVGGLGCTDRSDLETAARGSSDADPRGSMVRGQRSRLRSQAHDGASLIRVLGCGGCHSGVPTPERSIAGPLLVSDPGRDPASTFAYLRDSPRTAGRSQAHVPSFHLDDAEALALSLHLAGGSADGGDARRRLDAARATHGEVYAEDGAGIFRALNCAACHEHDGVEPRRNGPPLAGAASRLRPAALRGFLRRPHAVRPFGFEPGGGGRMPDFALSDAEADSIAAYLRTLPVRFESRGTSAPGALSPFRAAKARALLERKLSCLGCHSLDGEGGRIGPDLARAGERLTPEYLTAIISDPQHAMPGTVMPRPALPGATRDLVIAFLAARRATGPADGDGAHEAEGAGDTKGARDMDAETDASLGSSQDSVDIERAGYLSLIDHPITHPASVSVPGAETMSDVAHDPAASLYAARCAICHGAAGRGDGYNARYLRVQPAVHASADSMSRRPDDTLFDGIHAGGAILDGSAEMPAFGESLSAAQIGSLVDYIRKLCDCRQPAWADDG